MAPLVALPLAWSDALRAVLGGLRGRQFLYKMVPEGWRRGGGRGREGDLAPRGAPKAGAGGTRASLRRAQTAHLQDGRPGCLLYPVT